MIHPTILIIVERCFLVHRICKMAVSSNVSDSAASTATLPLTEHEVVILPSLFDKLRSPQLAEIGRKRKTSVNPPCGKRRSAGRGSFDPKSVGLAQRVREFPESQLCVSAGKLFCQACREELSTKLSVLKIHLKSRKHADSVKKREANEARERDIAQAIVVHDRSHPRGETLPTNQSMYRIKVVSAFLKAGVPLSKLECFRQILEEHAYRLTDRRHMPDLLPFILAEDQVKI